MAPQMQFVQEMSELVYSVVKTEDLDLFEFAFGRVVVAVSDRGCKLFCVNGH